MAKSIKTKYFSDATATCANCGSVYTLGGNKETISLEICGNCHPFYTGNETIIDTSGRIDRFKARMDVKPSDKKEKTRKSRKDSLNLYSGEVEAPKVEVKPELKVKFVKPMVPANEVAKVENIEEIIVDEKSQVEEAIKAEIVKEED
jgi:large subunit ribosomal protein L31